MRAGLFYARHCFAPSEKTKGSIINVGSTGGLVGYAGGSAYCASKAAAGMTTKTAALELASHGIRVNCICPGATKPVYDRHMIDIVIDRWDEFAKKLKDGKAPVFYDMVQ
jgi:NAD(P)-dependent dehydrogenase (short-subunit alcohol dehydrogenase family)